MNMDRIKREKERKREREKERKREREKERKREKREPRMNADTIALFSSMFRPVLYPLPTIHYPLMI